MQSRGRPAPWHALAVLGAPMLATFTFNTAENPPVGLLELISESLRVSLSAVGLLVTDYGVRMAVASVPLAHCVRAVLSRLPQSSRLLNEPSRLGFCLSEPSRATECAGGAGWLYRLGRIRRAVRRRICLFGTGVSGRCHWGNRSGRKSASISSLFPLRISEASSRPITGPSVMPLWETAS